MKRIEKERWVEMHVMLGYMQAVRGYNCAGLFAGGK